MQPYHGDRKLIFLKNVFPHSLMFSVTNPLTRDTFYRSLYPSHNLEKSFSSASGWGHTFFLSFRPFSRWWPVYFKDWYLRNWILYSEPLLWTVFILLFNHIVILFLSVKRMAVKRMAGEKRKSFQLILIIFDIILWLSVCCMFNGDSTASNSTTAATSPTTILLVVIKQEL